VAPTDAGERLLAQLRPALHDIQAALDEVGQLRAKPAGTVRMIASPMAVAMVVWSKLARFVRDYAEVVLDITMPAFISASSSSATWSPSRSRGSSARPSSPRRRTSTHTRSRKRRGT